MRKHICIVIILCGLSVSAFGQDLYDNDVIHTVQIYFSQSNWDYLLDSLYSVGEDRLLATAIIDGIQYDSVGVRYKGFSTYSTTRVKNPFNIKLDFVVDDQLHQGYGTLKLANVWSDPSFLREVLGYEIARKYMAAGLAAYANVSVNDVLIGLYVNVQDVDKLFTRTHFQSDEGARIKGETEGSPQVDEVWGYEGEDSSAYMDTYTLETEFGWSDLIDFLDTLNNYTIDVEKVLDVDRHLWMIAYDNLLVNLDAPINFAHNYYLYRDNSHRFDPIIWDLNMNFGGFSSVIGGQNLTISQMQQLTPFFNENNSNYPIVNKFMQNTTYRKIYIAHMKTIIEENFTNNWYQMRGVELQDIIATDVQADPNKFYSYGSFLSNLNSAVGDTPGIVQLMNTRAAYLMDLADFEADPPVISEVQHTPAELQANDSVTIIATVANASEVVFAYRHNMAQAFQNIAMSDDGTHGDGAAFDGIYGVSLAAGSADLHYYIYAENLRAAAFLPRRAEFEDSIITVTSLTGTGIVINEFQADNETTVTDQDGEFEDWIELLNTTSESIALGGFHLSDKIDNVGKWMFPDTSIGAGEYMIIWADEDDEQVGLHVSFKLSASGEAVVFANPDLDVMDQIVFGAQTADLSSSRCPDGSGAFSETEPSFGVANLCGEYVCGDPNADGTVNVGDAVYLINYIFRNDNAPQPPDAGDSNCDGSVNVGDVVYIIRFAFRGGDAPCCP